MDSLLKYQKKLLPDLLPVMQSRYKVLQYIRIMQPIGRRSLSASLGLTERVLRSEVLFLKEQHLINIEASGMTITEEGAMLLVALEEFMKKLTGLTTLEEELKEKLNVKQIIIVSGDSDESPWVKKEMARAAVMCIKKHFTANNIVAVTGGTTLAEVAEMMKPEDKDRNLLFVPARGGLGEDVANQANTICANMAQKTLGQHRLLHVPDQVSSEAYASIVEEPSVKQILDLIKASDMVIHGIGEAFTMAKRRNTSAEDLMKIEQGQAVGEAFGYYFNEQGEIVHKVLTIGMQLKDLKHVPTVISVAGGTSKGKAILSFMKKGHNSILITDEGAAKELLRDL
ncbi:sugar-binding transcriptional regulator [Priestia taiwanensis]|uniref:Central glycolytic genes regulator n=1 Tax=Priestia taiwanensis TaxID=1347902 RepID=A0A917ETZ2_9BACI|nr:sugar-binding transcriptional regulator [Priestia taiwanensis]MBM7364435.1 central glycolytic genes regulator [Priestia taiwanensis]GGE81488.1 central glycolytic genes regulator [Priestia taiwanensis]